MSDAMRSVRISALFERFGCTLSGRSHHPLLLAVQEARPRCVYDCRCIGCDVWRGLTDAILTHLEADVT